MSIKLDYTLESPEERKALVEKIIEEQGDSITPAYLEILADYLVLCMEKQERKQNRILTDNHMVTVNRHETSFEGLVGQLENGEDGIYNLINENAKNTIFKPKISITQQDLEDIPLLKQLREAIHDWEDALKRASGKDAFIIKTALIEMRRDQYVIKQAYKVPIIFKKIIRNNSMGGIKLDDTSSIYWNSENSDDPQNGELTVSGVSLMDHNVVSGILCNYSRLKQDSYGKFDEDTWYLMETFDQICDKALEDHPYYLRLVECKIDGM